MSSEKSVCKVVQILLQTLDFPLILLNIILYIIVFIHGEKGLDSCLKFSYLYL